MPTPTDATTTVALLTPPGEGGISVIQLAGPDAIRLLRRIFRVKGSEAPTHLDSSRIYYGTLIDEAGMVLDEVIVHPRRDAVEINCHGGVLVTRQVMDRLVALGARETTTPVRFVRDAVPAHGHAGGTEFSRKPSPKAAPPAPVCRPLRGVQAEAWQALVSARTGLAAAILLDQYHGALSRRVAELIDLVGAGQGGEAASQLDALLETARVGLRLTRPPRLVIAGRANVGKSSLLNAFLGRPRALVHESPGTTRDYLDTVAAVEDLPVVFLDTAGVGAPGDAIEEAGIQRALEQALKADLILAVFDGSEPMQPGDRCWRTARQAAPNSGESPLPRLRRQHQYASPCEGSLAQHLGGRAVIPVINKIDLPQRLDEADVVAVVGRVPSRVSALTGEGLGALRRRLAADLFGPLPAAGAPVVFTRRQCDLLTRAREVLRRDPAAAAEVLRRLAGRSD